MRMTPPRHALIQGVHDRHSLCWAIAEAFAAAGAQVCLTYRGERTRARVEALAAGLPGGFALPLDVRDDAAIATLASHLSERWDCLHAVVVGAARARPEDMAALVGTSRDGFHEAMDASVYGLIAVTRAVRPLLTRTNGATVTAISYLGARRVVPGYGVMGVAKAALEAGVRYLAADLGPEGIRVNAISAGPMRTVAASGVPGALRPSEVAARTPLRRAADQRDVGALALHLASASGVTGEVIEVDAGLHLGTA